MEDLKEYPQKRRRKVEKRKDRIEKSFEDDSISYLIRYPFIILNASLMKRLRIGTIEGSR